MDEFEEKIRQYCKEKIEDIRPNELYAYICEFDTNRIEQLKSNLEVKRRIKDIATKELERMTQHQEKEETTLGPPAKRKRAAADKSDSKASSPKAARPKKMAAQKQTTVPKTGHVEGKTSQKRANSSGLSLSKLITLFKLRKLYREVPKSRPDYEAQMKERIIDCLMEQGIIQKRALPSLAEAQKWREKHDMEEELKSIKHDIDTYGLEPSRPRRQAAAVVVAALKTPDMDGSTSSEEEDEEDRSNNSGPDDQEKHSELSPSSSSSSEEESSDS